MQKTIFDNLVFSFFLRSLGLLILKLFRWKIEGNMPKDDKFVIIGAPHTSNWDFLLMMAIMAYFRVPISWMGKKELFRGVFGHFFRYLGGIAIDRDQTLNTVDSIVNTFNKQTKMVLVLAPEGTRKAVPRWKSGFYHIAYGAKIPIVLGFLDYKNRVGGVLDVFYPSGDAEKEIPKIQEYYQNISGKKPELFHKNP